MTDLVVAVEIVGAKERRSEDRWIRQRQEVTGSV